MGKLNKEMDKGGINTYRDNDAGWKENSALLSSLYVYSSPAYHQSHEFNDCDNNIEAETYTYDDDSTETVNEVNSINAATGSTIASSVTGTTVGGAAAATTTSTISGVTTAASTSGAVVGGIASVGATVAVVAVVATGATTITNQKPVVSVPTIEAGYRIASFSIPCTYYVDTDFTVTITSDNKIVFKNNYSGSVPETKSEDESYPIDLGGSLKGLTVNTTYNIDVSGDYGYGNNSIYSGSFQTKYLSEKEQIYGDLSLGSYGVDYDTSTLSYTIDTSKDVNSYLYDITVIASSPFGGGTITSTTGEISLASFTKGYYIELEMQAKSKHPFDIEDNNTDFQTYGKAVIYY